MRGSAAVLPGGKCVAALLCGVLVGLALPAFSAQIDTADESASAISVARSATAPQSAEALFASMAITVPADQNGHFVATDGVDGFFSGHTRVPGLGRYLVRDNVLLQGIVSEVAGVAQRRPDDVRATQWVPNRIQTEYSAAGLGAGAEARVSERVVVHHGQRALSVQLTAADRSALAITLQWAATAPPVTLAEQTPGIWTGALNGQPEGWHVAIASDQDGIQLSTAAPADINSNASAAAKIAHSRFAVTNKATELTLHLAFARTERDAITAVRGLVGTDALNRSAQTLADRLQCSRLVTSDPDYNRALLWASASANGFVVEEFGKGIWAGLPWFRDNWGRDTFIALPGTLLVTGQLSDAKAVLDNFARYQKRGSVDNPEYGRVPNRVAAGDSIIYNTADGTPWLIRELLEYLRYSGDAVYGQRMLPLIREYIRGVERHWLDASGLLTHDDADTWMDARIAGQQAWSPRGNRAVEIQALWFTALDVAARLSDAAGLQAEATGYRQRMALLRERFAQLFWNGEHMADRLLADGSKDFSLRPNQLMLVSIPFSPFVADEIQARITRNAVSGLLYPYGIASLDPKHANFHPRHENPAFHHKDAAYHNGTVWGWNAGFTVTALNKFGYQDLAWQLSANLAGQILNAGTAGSMSELLDALPDDQGRVKPSGTYAQAWSVSEFVRNAYQDYLGFRPDLLGNQLHFVPALPSAWRTLAARLSYGAGEVLHVQVQKQGTSWRWTFAPEADKPRQIVMDLLASDQSRRQVAFTLTGKPQQLSWDGQHAQLDGVAVATVPVMASQAGVIGTLKFLVPAPYQPAAYPVLRGKDVLQQQLLLPPAVPHAPANQREK